VQVVPSTNQARNATCRNDKALSWRALSLPSACLRPKGMGYRANEVYGVGVLPVGHFVSPVTGD